MLLLHLNFLQNLLLFVSSISVGKGKLQKERHSSMSLFAVLNNFIKNLMTVTHGGLNKSLPGTTRQLVLFFTASRCGSVDVYVCP